MATAENLMNMTQDVLPPHIFKKLAHFLNQPTEKVQASVKSILPIFLLGVINKAATQEGAESLVTLVKTEGYDQLSSHELEMIDETHLKKGQTAVVNIFGSHLGPVATRLSSTTGLQTRYIKKIMSTMAPFVLAKLGSKIRRDHLSPCALMGFLGQQKSYLSQSTSVPAVPITIDEKPSDDLSESRPWIVLGTLALLFIGLLAWFASHKSSDELLFQPLPTSESTKLNQVDYSQKIPTISNLNDFLKTKGKKELPQRFVFEQVLFSTGDTQLTEEAQREIDTIVKILTIHPHVEARIEGFTDNLGSWDSNINLSRQRAKAVREQLILKGVAANRLEAIGRGQEAPVASNDTEKGRTKNRRIEFVVTNIQ